MSLCQSWNLEDQIFGQPRQLNERYRRSTQNHRKEKVKNMAFTHMAEVDGEHAEHDQHPEAGAAAGSIKLVDHAVRAAYSKPDHESSPSTAPGVRQKRTAMGNSHTQAGALCSCTGCADG
jgi:hypothetical protein